MHPRRDYDVKLTRLSTFFLFGPLTTLMVFTCFRCDVANYHRKLKFDELVTVCRQNMQEIITLFFWQVLIISSPSCLEWSPLFSSEKIIIFFVRGLRPFFRSAICKDFLLQYCLGLNIKQYLLSYHLKLRSFRTNCRSIYPPELFLLPSPKSSRRRSRKVLAILVIICMIYIGHLISLASSNESKGSIGITVYVTCTQ